VPCLHFFCFLIELIDNKFSRSMELEQAKGRSLTNNLREREREREREMVREESSEWVSKRFGCAKWLFYL